MLQVRKSHSCGISAIFFQCCFMIETQVLITVSDFFCFFSRVGSVFQMARGRELHFSPTMGNPGSKHTLFHEGN